ncbi:fibronectin-binding A domain-containing protein [Methanocaldococcus villosus KIN24-T80]|uniref:Archaeal Rqc2 homolog aRqcH n=1 Tax=Methanocaldococcus villosus KIN24-T80 TaxID=1069083 RepID=N6V1Z4_9EURY|nr:ribosome rescue protein RqcH [Methanocaldococcus villosus]ENN96308.1 fibronectin-binding A domain-containing protein [Methanocaldococcus villosus KIN24-T80]
MKNEITNIDLAAVVEELQMLINGRVDKAFLINNEQNKELILKVHVPEKGSRELVISVGKYKYVTLTNYEREKPKLPPSFAMLLRKHLKNSKITKIEQINFDRILLIEFQNKYKLIAELFKDGNIIFLDENNTIIAPLRIEEWKDRRIAPKENYKFPPQKPLSPKNLEYSLAYELFEEYFIKNSDVECVRLLSRILGIAGIYAEEICERANIDKKKKNLNKEEIKQLFEKAKELFNEVYNNRKPQIIIKDGEYIDVQPIELKKYSDYEKKYYNSFLEAIDDYFAKFLALKEVKKEKSKLEEEIEKHEAILRRQLETLKKYKEESEENSLKGDLIYANYQLVEELLNAIRFARERKSWEEIKKIIRENKNHPILGLIENIDENSGKIVVRLKSEDMEERVALDIRKNAFENAEVYYEKAKKLKSKLEGIENAIELTKKKIEDLKKKSEEEIKEIEEKKMKKKKRKERKWYEKFKWTVINGFLVLAGKDAITNEILIKKYTDKDDIVFHADIQGAPFTVIKTEGREVDEDTLLEVAKFSVSHSKAWKLGYGAIDTYWVKPEQISKTPESGEYLKRGAFVIRGKRNYIRSVPLELGIGVIEYDGEIKITTAPPKTLEKSFIKYVLLKPSNKDKGKVVKELKKIFEDYGIDDEDILMALPPGGCEIIQPKP